MPKAPKTPAKATPDKPRVAVVGGGIAGLTAALRLAQSGCQVTIYEAKDRLGGNLSSAGEPGAPYQDVYPHIFPDWYANFWSLFENDLGLSRKEHFAERWAVKVLDKPQGGPSATEAPKFMDMVYAPTLKSVLTTMKSGVLSVPDFFLFAFLNLDLAAQPPDPTDTDMLCQLDVNGYFYSRGYSTDAIAALQDYVITVIWSIPSDMTSAKVYKRFIKHQLSSLGPNTPYAWMLKGSLQERVIGPLERKLTEPELGCEILTGTSVRSVEVLESGAPRILLDRSGAKGGVEEAPPVDYVVMAVPGMELGEMVMRGAESRRLVDKVPDLAQVRRVWGEAIPVVNLHFNRKLPFIPEEIVGLRGSGYDLTILDISQLWDRDDQASDATVLVLAGSNAYAIPAEAGEAQAYLMIKRLREYLHFDLGGAWGDSTDIDWARTTVRQNNNHLLFVNDVGSRIWRPRAAYAALPNVFFAGDVCQTDVDMATVEAAVQSGVMAAKALQQVEMAPGAKQRMAQAPITLTPHKVFSDATFLAAKLALLPVAYAASAWSAVQSTVAGRKSGADAVAAYSRGRYALLLPLNFAMDWWRTAYWLDRSLRKGAHEGGVEGVDAADTPVGLGVKGLWASGHTSKAASAGAEPAPGGLASALGVFAGQLVNAVQAARKGR